MSFLFKTKPKTPLELVKSCKEYLINIERKQEDISKVLFSMKNILYGDSENEPVPELIAQLAQEIYNHDLLLLLVENIVKLEFEARKDVVQIFNNLLRRQIGTRSPTIEYLCTKESTIFYLIQGYRNQEIALNSGMMLRECAKFEPLTKIILFSDEFFSFFEFVELSTFDIASDAFATFKDLLTRHKTLVPEFLSVSYDKFFDKFNVLLNSSNYVTRRQSLKLLGEILLDRSNFEVMTKFISNTENLKLLMNFLRDKSRNIQFEAFHVFKIFVANPNKPKAIHDILYKNQEKLISFLTNFHNDRTDDEQFIEEKNFLIKQIQSLST